MKSIYYLILCSLLLIACSGEDNTDSAGEPSNLTVEVEVSENNSGKVDFIARADNTDTYELRPSDGGDTILSSQDGEFQYVYEFSGNYNAEIRAIGNSGRYISADRLVNIEAENGVDTSQGYITPLMYEGMDLVWNDEFDQNLIDSRKWTFDIGDGCPNLCGWGNNELEYYRAQNCTVSNGVLRIQAEDIPFANRNYTSGKMLTREKYTFNYGRVDVRAKLPEGKGFWPAVWMLGANHPVVGWPKCGEIDIMEMIGGHENESHGTAHWFLDGGRTSSGNSRSSLTGLQEEFHVFSIIWDERFIRWYLNDVEYHSLNIESSDKEAFQKEFFLIVNLAVGGDWPGNPTNETQFPASMLVDYVRVFQKS